MLQATLQERTRLEKAGRLHWIHWLVVLFSLALTFAAWDFSRRQVEEKNGQRFERNAGQIIDLIRERMQRYEDALWSGVSAIQAAGGTVSHDAWRSFADSLNLTERYPGINGIGVIDYVPPESLEAYLAQQRRTRPDFQIHPAHDRGEYWPITYIEPEDINRKAVGLDIAHEINRYSAAVQARDSGQAQITGPIVLVQDAEQTPGFLFYTPYYRSGRHDAVEARRAEFVGLVYAPFVMK